MKKDIGHAAQLAMDKEKKIGQMSIDMTDGGVRRRSVAHQHTDDEPSTWRSCSSLPEAEVSLFTTLDWLLSCTAFSLTHWWL